MNYFSSPEIVDNKLTSKFSRVFSNILNGIKTTPRSSKRLHLAKKYARTVNEDHNDKNSVLVPKESEAFKHDDTNCSSSTISCANNYNNTESHSVNTSCCSDSTRGDSMFSDRTSTSLSECGTVETIFTEDLCYLDCDSNRSTLFQPINDIDNMSLPLSLCSISDYSNSISLSSRSSYEPTSQQILHINKSTKQQILLSKLILPSLKPDPANTIGWYKNKEGEIIYITTQDSEIYINHHNSNSSSSSRSSRSHRQLIDSYHRYPSLKVSKDYFYISTKEGQLIGMPTLDLSTCGLPSYSYHLYKRKRPTYNTSQ